VHNSHRENGREPILKKSEKRKEKKIPKRSKNLTSYSELDREEIRKEENITSDKIKRKAIA